MKRKYLILLGFVVLTGCSSLKGLVKNIEGDLNNVLDGGHGIVTNAVSTVTAPLK